MREIFSPQQRVARICPMGCVPGMIQFAISQGLPRKPAHSRCMQCLTYWITDPEGRIMELYQGLQAKLCVKCKQVSCICENKEG